jgi:hypothetical protein
MKLLVAIFFGFAFATSQALASAPASVAEAAEEEQTCTWEDREACGCKGSNQKAFTVGVVEGTEETFCAYDFPDIATYYNATPGSIKAKRPKFNGLFGKFINLSKDTITVYWKQTSGKKQNFYIADVAPFGSAGTATYPGHNFVLTPRADPDTELLRIVVKAGNSLYKYDPYGSIEEAAKALNAKELELYKLQFRSLAFNSVYQHTTNRQWLALYGRKHAPKYFMWPADSFGQTHTVTTQETHIVSLPDDHAAKGRKKISNYGATPEERADLKAFRSPEPTLNLTLKVLSVEPRVFEIQNFLSPEEVAHMVELGTGMQLSRSTTYSGIAQRRTHDDTRTSKNSWISRESSSIVDSVFRRAADLLNIDEAYFRSRQGNETNLVPESKGPICERLQLVHYSKGQQYTPHHVSLSLVFLLASASFDLVLMMCILSVFLSLGLFRSRYERWPTQPLRNCPLLPE